MNYNKLSIIKSNNKVVRKKDIDIDMERLRTKFVENNVYLDQGINDTFQIRIPNNID